MYTCTYTKQKFEKIKQLLMSNKLVFLKSIVYSGPVDLTMDTSWYWVFKNKKVPKLYVLQIA